MKSKKIEEILLLYNILIELYGMINKLSFILGFPHLGSSWERGSSWPLWTAWCTR